MERCKSAPKLGSIEESPELEEVEEKDWLRVLALRGSTTPLVRTNTVAKPVSPTRSSLETVREEERLVLMSTPPPSMHCKLVTESELSPDAVSPNGLLVRNIPSLFLEIRKRVQFTNGLNVRNVSHSRTWPK